MKLLRNSNGAVTTEHILLIAFVLTLFFAAVQTQYIQEDAFIYFRTARNIVSHGDYSFNIGASYPGATSSIYAFFVAALIGLFGEFALLALQAVNFFVAIIGALALSASTLTSKSAKPQFTPYIFIFTILSPPFLTLAISGMETPFLFTSLSLLLLGVSRRLGPLIAAASVVIVLMRVEAAIAVVLAAALVALTRDFKLLSWTIAGLIVGFFTFSLTNFIFVGEIIPQTITAKATAYTPGRSVGDISLRIWDIFFEQSFFLGLSSRFIPEEIYIVVGFSGITLLAVTLVKPLLYKVDSSSHQRSNTIPALVAIIILAFSLGYTYGGVIFPWYLWPSSVFSYFLTAWLMWRFNSQLRFASTSLIIAMGVLSIVNLLVMKNIGNQESQFRASVGLYISREAEDVDTLFLEPAGYIPYFANIRTWDTVGLVSPDILKYRNPENLDWWMDFVIEHRPTWIVERSPIHAQGTPDATRPEGFTAAERVDFNTLYDLNHTFNYREYLERSLGVMSPIYMLGSHSDYYLYRLRTSDR